MKRLFAFVTALALAGCATMGTMKGPHVAARHPAVHHLRHAEAPKATAPVPAPAPAAVIPAPAPAPVVNPAPKRKRWLDRFESRFHRKGK